MAPAKTSLICTKSIWSKVITTTNHTHTRTHHTVQKIDQLEMRQHMILLAMRSGAQRALD